MSEFNIQTTTEEGVCHIRLAGRVTFTMCRRFDAFIDELFQEPLSDIILDLRKTDHIDSTMLGLLAKIARIFIERYHHKPALISTRDDINILLDSMGFEAAFKLRTHADSEPFFLEDIPLLEKSVPMPETLLEAHSLLMDLDARNVERFGDTVDALRDSVDRTAS
ncbi:MAG: STAS domain-containing protein [Verrucomicrobia bacterium]|nr:STAS domain-containing protein [Verrucomicrobiota bacterium]MBT7067246.1 STAS domain-containing protein [Verrucomicrobiota bacterium]MBT7699429.1 STAS domain-containing protein [Verrucomicrobiota bacterium]